MIGRIPLSPEMQKLGRRWTQPIGPPQEPSPKPPSMSPQRQSPYLISTNSDASETEKPTISPQKKKNPSFEQRILSKLWLAKWPGGREKSAAMPGSHEPRSFEPKYCSQLRPCKPIKPEQ